MTVIPHTRPTDDFFFRITCRIPRVCEGCFQVIPSGATIAARGGHLFHEDCAVPPKPERREYDPACTPAPTPRPHRMRSGPTYDLDHASLAYQLTDPLGAVEVLVDEMARRPAWDRAGQCWGCEHWSAKQGLGRMPRRPYAEDPTQTCCGCLWSHLDETRPARIEA